MRLKILKIAGVVTGLAVLSAYLFLDIFASESAMKFDQAMWKSAWQTPTSDSSGSEVKKYPRKAMLDDLMNGPLLAPGVSKSAVIELLGQGKTFYDGKVLSYLIGPSDWSVDFNNLVIEFDANERLAKRYLWAYDSPPPLSQPR
ncbi:MAG: hypothetical protein V2J55_17570 [Candidatus Competibacteraceae bacterium]|jgi:hypothetical protein|nr:hypothetical protein [Candidatus Competibacteraceae bacterium]